MGYKTPKTALKAKIFSSHQFIKCEINVRKECKIDKEKMKRCQKEDAKNTEQKRKDGGKRSRWRLNGC